MTVTVRAAAPADIPAMEALIKRSGIELSEGFYTAEQARAVTQHVFGVDTQLVADRTKKGVDALLDPATEPARIRAFFVEPSAARRGLGRLLLQHCTDAAADAGFHTLELAATMPGVPLYLACGFSEVDTFEITLPGPVQVPLTRMRKAIVLKAG